MHICKYICLQAWKFAAYCKWDIMGGIGILYDFTFHMSIFESESFRQVASVKNDHFPGRFLFNSKEPRPHCFSSIYAEQKLFNFFNFPQIMNSSKIYPTGEPAA